MAVLLFSSILSAQNLAITNQKTLGGSNADKLNSVVQLSNGDVVAIGSSRSGISGDKDDTYRAQEDYWIVCMDAALNVKWQKTIGGDSIDIPQVVIQTNDGNILCAGYSNSSVSFDKTAANKGGYDYWIIKLDTSGNELWQKTYGGAGDDYATDLKELNDGSLLISGHSDSEMGGDKSDSSRGYADYWLVKVDFMGNILWDKTFGGSGVDYWPNLAVTSAGEIVLSGNTTSPVSGDKTEPLYGLVSIWVLKLNDSGNYLWDKCLGGENSQFGGIGGAVNGWGIPVEINTDLFILGNSDADSTGTKTENSKGDTDYWITKLDANGGIVWDKTIGGISNDGGTSLLVSSAGELLLSGSSLSGVSGDKEDPMIGNSDFWIVAIDTTGVIQWQKTIGGTDFETLAQTIETEPGKFLIAGYSESGADGDKTEPSRGQEDYWIVELSLPTGIPQGEEQVISFFPFPNPSLGTLNIQLPHNYQGDYKLRVYDAAGKIIMSDKVIGSTHIVSTNTWENGMYFVQLTDKTDTVVATTKIIIQHP
jgi:hypothetical protein